MCWVWCWLVVVDCFWFLVWLLVSVWFGLIVVHFLELLLRCWFGLLCLGFVVSELSAV